MIHTTLVSNDPSFWPDINIWRISSYLYVVASAGVIYDWTLTIGQEVELIWRQRWSLMTALYLSARYLGISYAVIQTLGAVPTIPLTDLGCLILSVAQLWVAVVVRSILGVIIVTRLHAMYQQSRKVLIFLVVILLAVNVSDVVVNVINTRNMSAEELILSGTYECYYAGDFQLLVSINWIINTTWEVLALCLALWIAVKHFRELRRQSAGGIIGDGFTVLITSHVVYFVSFVLDSCFTIGGDLSPTLSGNPYSLGSQIYFGFLEIFEIVQLCVLGPRLILSIREYYAKREAESDPANGMTSIVFQERVHVSTGSSV